MNSRSIVASLSSIGLLAGAMLVSAPAAEAATTNLNCPGIHPLEGYEPCYGDNFRVASGRSVYLKNTTSSKGVNFKLYNRNGHRLLATSPLLAPGSNKFVWRNDTSSTIEVEVEADPNSSSTVDVSAVATY